MARRIYPKMFYFSILCFLAFTGAGARDSFGTFTQRPSEVLPVKVGMDATFVWDWTRTGVGYLLATWCKLDPVAKQCRQNILMTKKPAMTSPLVATTNTEFASRTVGIAPFTMKIKNIRLSDDGIFKFTVQFDDGQSYYDHVHLMVLITPVITRKSIGNIVVKEGEKTKLDCGVGVGNPKPFDIQWWHNNIMLSTTKSNFEAPFVFNNTLRKDGGTYRCIAKNQAGQDFYDVNLAVVYSPENVAIIPSANGVVRIQEGRNLTLNCHADGVPKPTYEWTRIRLLYREKLTSKSQKSSYFFKRVDKTHADEYECAANNIHGRKVATVILDVLYRPEILNFSINMQNTTVVYVPIGQSANFSCKAISSPAASYHIGFRGSPTAKSIERTYLINSVKETDTGVYECVTNNGIGSAARAIVELVVVVKPADIQVRGKPHNPKLNAGTNLVLRCEMTGSPRPYIYWTLNGAYLTYDLVRREINGTYPDKNRRNIHFSEIHFSPLRRFDDGEFKCFGQNHGGSIEKNYPLEVNYAPYITIFPKNVTILENGQAELSCRAIGKPPLSSYLWRRNGIILPETSEKIYFPRANRVQGGRYTCAGINTVATGPVATAYLIVMYKPEFTVIPPKTQTVNASANIRLQCNATGAPKPVITWTKDGGSKSLGSSEVLFLYNVNHKDKGIYQCKASNKIGNITVKSNLLINHKPVITTNDPSSTKIGSDIGVNAPPVILVCTVDAFPAATITWSRGITRIEKGTKGFAIKEQSTSSYLTVTVTDDSRRGSYTCTATNRLGTISQEYQILKKSQPDPPVPGSLKTEGTLELTDPPTVKIKITWIPGYNGGFPVTFRLFFREYGTGNQNFQQENIGTSANNVHTLRGLKPQTSYEFTMRAVNEKGESREYLPYHIHRTRAAPPRRGSASARRYGTSGTQVQVSWTINDHSKAKSVIVRYKRTADFGWREEVAAYINGTVIISSLDNTQTYEFQVFIVYKDGSKGMPIGAGQVQPGGGGGTAEGKVLSKQDIIAIVVGVGGFLLILIVVCTLVMLKKKKKHGVDGHFEMKTNSTGRGKGNYTGYSTGGSDVIRAAVLHTDNDNEYADDEDIARQSEPLAHKKMLTKDSPPPYDDHFSYYDGTEEHATTSFQQPRNPVGNTPAYSSFSALSSQKRPLLQEPEPVTKSDSRTSLVSGRAAEISRKNRTPFENIDYRGDGKGSRFVEPDRNSYDDEIEADAVRATGRNGREGDRDRYNYRPEQKQRGPRGSSSGGPSTDDDLPSPPPFMRDLLTNVHSDSERVPGSLGERLGKNRNVRLSPQHSPVSQRSGASSNQYRSDTEYIEDDGDNYVGYLV